MEKVNLAERFAKFSVHWSPKVVGELNDCEIKLLKIQGDFVRRKHEATDESFFVPYGAFHIVYRDRQLNVGAGERQ